MKISRENKTTNSRGLIIIEFILNKFIYFIDFFCEQNIQVIIA